MADDPTVNGASPTATFRAAADEVTSVNGGALGYSSWAQRVKIDWKGVNGEFWDVSQATPLPVSFTQTALVAGSAIIGKVGIDQTTPGTTNGVSVTNASIAVTGTFWQATQPISGSVSVSGSVAVTGTFWQATQPISGTITANAGSGTFAVSAASLPLPTGAATAAKQPALGTAGAASADVLTVQGAASMTALKVDGSAVTQPVSAASLPLPSGAATSAKQDTLLAAVQAATPAGENHIGAVGGNSVVVGGSFSRPADTTAYVVGDLIANSTTAGSVTPISAAAARVNAGTGVIRRVRVSTTQTGLTGTEIVRVHLFKTSPTVSNGDNGAFSANGITSLALGYVDVVLNHVYNDGAKGFTATDVVFDAAGGSQNIFALLETRTALTPTSAATYALALEVLQD